MAEPAYLIDTNILLRIARRDAPAHGIVGRALTSLALAGSALCYMHQNIAEFWNVATPPVDCNGFGLSAAEVDDEVTVIERGMVLLPDSEAITTNGAVSCWRMTCVVFRCMTRGWWPL